MPDLEEFLDSWLPHIEDFASKPVGTGTPSNIDLGRFTKMLSLARQMPREDAFMRRELYSQLTKDYADIIAEFAPKPSGGETKREKITSYDEAYQRGVANYLKDVQKVINPPTSEAMTPTSSPSAVVRDPAPQPTLDIPTPNEYTKKYGHNPFPPRWDRWLSSVREAILTSQPTAGRHVSVDQHPGKGTVINIDDTSARRHATPSETCPTPLLIQFSGVTFCGCTPNSAGTFSYTLTDSATNPFNGYHAAGFNLGFGSCPNDCVWHLGVTTNVYNVDATIWPSADCSGTPSTETDSITAIIIVLLSGTYHLAAVGPFDGIIFYGTSTALFTPFSNTVTCNPLFTTWDNPAIECIFGAPTSLSAIAHGGTATVTHF